MRCLIGFFFVLALAVMGCSETSGTGGSGGDGGVGGDGGSGGMTGQEFPCTEQGIRDAIAEGGGPHTFDCAEPPTVVETESQIVIDKNVILDGEGSLTVDGNLEHRVFLVEEGVTAELHGLTVARGGWTEPDPFEESGGGIMNLGTLTLSNCTVTQCSIPASGNPMGFASGGGIANNATLTITDSTVSGNSSAEWGGGIASGGTLTLTNSTVSGNSPDGLRTVHEGTVAVINSTVSDNRDAAITKVGGPGTVTLAASLIDGTCDVSDPDISITSNGYNIESPGDTCGFDADGTDLVNVTTEELSLGPLADNGGPTEERTTFTHALLTEPLESVAIDHIPGGECGVSSDQRGFPRPAGDGCDVGAFEVQP